MARKHLGMWGIGAFAVGVGIAAGAVVLADARRREPGRNRRPRANPDGELVARVRTAIGRIARGPQSIDVEAREGHVHLRGPIMPDEAALILSTVRVIPGVTDVTMHGIGVASTPGNARVHPNEPSHVVRPTEPAVLGRDPIPRH